VSEILLEARDLVKHFPVRKGVRRRQVGAVRAVDGVSLQVRAGETLGLVGESGSGKSTLARCLVRMLMPTAGEIEFGGRRIEGLGDAALRPLRRELQMVFQDPYASLNPRKRVGAIVGAPLRMHQIGDRAARRKRVLELLEAVGLTPDHYERFPHEFSGGQRQRVSIARALALAPRLIVADEPVSALDVSVQAQILNLLADLRDELGLTYVFVSHDLAVVRQVSDRVAVMYLGRLVEVSPAEELYQRPIMPYTAALLAAVPEAAPPAGRERIVLRGEVASALAPPPGCRLHPRCPFATDVCREVEPPLRDFGGGHVAACHHPLNVNQEVSRNAAEGSASSQP